MSHLDRRKTQTMVQHTNTKQNWYQVSSSKTSAKAADKELHSQFTCVHLYLFLTWNLIVKLIRWPHGLVDGFLLRSFHHFAGCKPQEPKIAGVYSTLVSSLHYSVPAAAAVCRRGCPHNCGFPPPLPCWSWSAVQLLSSVTMQHRSNLVITIYYLLSRYWFEIIFDGFIYCTVFSMILIRWSNKYFPKFIRISISASNLDNIQYNLYVYPSISRGQHRQQKMQSQTSGSQQGQYSPAPRFRWNDSDPFFILVSCFFIWSIYFFFFLFISLSFISKAAFSNILFWGCWFTIFFFFFMTSSCAKSTTESLPSPSLSSFWNALSDCSFVTGLCGLLKIHNLKIKI